ncbi:DPOD4 polymerase, partial [Calonectris borealis]|nr:DPOD4 polymerase [Calonectris borealis]
MEQPRRITDSFPRRRRSVRAPGRVKGRGCPRPAVEPPTPPPPDLALLEMLRRFDLAWEYGPCTGEAPRFPPRPRSAPWVPPGPADPAPPIGITRLQRWERAQALGLSPPGPVRDALLEHRDNPDVTYRWVRHGG